MIPDWLKEQAQGKVIGFAVLFAFMAMLGHGDRGETPQPMDTAGIGSARGDSEMDVGDPPSPSNERVEFCINNKTKLEADPGGGGEHGRYCRLLLLETSCSQEGDCPDDPYEDPADSEEHSNASGI